jgi:hypothetical protein
MGTLLNQGPRCFGRVALATIAMTGLLAFATTPRALADADDCQRRIARADHKLHEAAERHGWDSRQADHWRHELHDARERCWRDYHRWWDEDAHRWRTDHDWDDHDHDHGH